MQLQIIQALADADYWQVLATLIKAMTYGSSFAAAGGVIFIALFSSRINAQEEDAVRQFVRLASIIAIVLSVVRIAVTNGMLSGEVSGMFDWPMTRMVLASSEGLATALRCLGCLMIWTMISSAKGWRQNIHLLGALIASTSFAWVGHAGELEPTIPLVPQLLLLIHLIGVTFWIGALWPLHQLAKSNSPHLAKIAERFGYYAGFIVMLLIAVGSALLWMLAISNDTLFSTAYGQLFVLKLFSVALLLAGAGLNKLWLTPQLLQGDQSAFERLGFSIKLEIALVSFILVLTAGFTTIVGPFK